MYQVYVLLLRWCHKLCFNCYDTDENRGHLVALIFKRESLMSSDYLLFFTIVLYQNLLVSEIGTTFPRKQQKLLKASFTLIQNY